LCRALGEDGIEVTALVRPTSNRVGLEGVDVRTIEGDVLDQASLVAAAAGCGAIFHNAAVFEIHSKDPDALHRVAVEGARNAVTAAASAGARLVFTSSVVAVGFGEKPGDLLPSGPAPRPNALMPHVLQNRWWIAFLLNW
jgi:dihydroflavonol-4-reductase